MTTELLRPGYSNISCIEDEGAFSSAVMSTELEAQLRKKDKVFLKRLKLFFQPFVKEKGKVYLSTKGALYTFQAVTSERNTF